MSGGYLKPRQNYLKACKNARNLIRKRVLHGALPLQPRQRQQAGCISCRQVAEGKQSEVQEPAYQQMLTFPGAPRGMWEGQPALEDKNKEI